MTTAQALCAVDEHEEHLLLRVFLMVVCGWELAGLNKVQVRGYRVPTISSKVLPLPVWQRVAIIGAAAGVLFDHWVTRRWT